MSQPNNETNGMSDQLTESLGRLSKKTGVLATIVLDRATGSILKTTGTLSTETGVIPALTTPAATAEAAGLGERNGISDIALMAWNIVNAAGGLIQGLDNEDEVKLLRLRTKKHEFIIVPDLQYLLIAIHETPPA